MKLHNMPQGTPEWLAARIGKFTGTDAAPCMLEPRKINLTTPQIQEILASMGIPFLKSAAKPVLIAALPDPLRYMELSTAARRIILKKITESKPQDAWQVAQADKIERQFEYLIQIQRGTALEPAARAYYQRRTGAMVTEVGFISNDAETYGMSPDGLVFGPDGRISHGVEIKCPFPETHKEYLLDGVLPGDYEFQCHMGMVCAECDRWDFLSFCPGDAQFLFTVHRSPLTEQLAAGLKIMVEEKAKIELQLADFWEDEHGTPEGRALLTYLNGRPMFDEKGQMLDESGELLEIQPQDT